jgi:hypothetical protein
VVVVLFVGALTGVWAGWFLETSTHAFPIFSCIFNGVFMFDLLPLFRCFPEVWRGRFGLFLCHSLLLALAFHPPGWGLVSDSGTIACLELLW